MQTRQSQRKRINLPGRYFTGHGSPVAVNLHDLSVGGCRFASDSAKLVRGSRVQIFIAGSGPHHASIKWVEKGEVGVTFAKPLTLEQFEQFQAGHVPDLAQSIKVGEFEEMPGGLPQRFC